MTEATPPSPPAGPADPRELLRSRSYLVLLVLGAVIGAPVAAVAYFFLKAISRSQTYLFTTLPVDLGFDSEPIWWPLPLLAIGGLIVGLAIRYLPGTGGHPPSEGFKAAGPVPPIELPGIVVAAFATLAFGAVLGPEAPLIAIGSGLGVLAIYLLRRDAPTQATVVIAAAGSFASVSTLLGSPLTGAFLLMEAAGIGGPMLGIVLLPGLLAAGIGALIFVGLDSWTGYGTFSLAIPDIPPFDTPTAAEFGWALGIGVAGAVVAAAIRRGAIWLRPLVEPRMVLLTPVVGLGVAGLAMAFQAGSDKDSSQVLFSGQDSLPSLIQDASDWTVGALVLLVACKALAYVLSLCSFRGGPVFPGMFIGAAGGIALSHVGGLPMIAGAAMGIAAVTAAMLGLPLTAVLLTVIFLQADALALTPLVIVSAVVAYVLSAQLMPKPPPETRSARAAPAGT